MDFTIIIDNWRYLLWGTFPHGPLGGAALTIVISLISGVGSAALGIVLGVALTVTRGIAALILTAIVGFLRAIPVIMLIFWTYFLLPITFGINISEITTVVCALTLISASYLAHTVKAGIKAVSIGQWQAGLSLGFSRWQILQLLVLPQALRMMLPSFINQWIALIKDTSLAYIIGIHELTYLAMQINNNSMVYPMEIFLFIAIVYFLLCLTLELISNIINWRFNLSFSFNKE